MVEIISTILSLAMISGVFALAFTYIWTQAKGGKSKAEHEIEEANSKLNATLEELIKSYEKKYDELYRLNQENQTEIANLKGRVDELSRQNGDLQNLISRALTRYFDEHPEEALKLATIKSMRKEDIKSN
jgi:predicted outer membrane protein